MNRRILFVLLICFLLFTIIDSKHHCSCTCCKGNRCIARHQGTLSVPTCSLSICKHKCKHSFSQCGGSPGSITSTCTKTKSPHGLSPIKKIKQKLTPTKKPSYHRPY